MARASKAVREASRDKPGRGRGEEGEKQHRRAHDQPTALPPTGLDLREILLVRPLRFAHCGSATWPLAMR